MTEPTYELEPDDGSGEAPSHSLPALRCRTCGSALTVAPSDGICPECDCPVAGPEAVRKISEDDRDAAGQSGWPSATKPGGKPLPPKCEGCGYDLRGHGASAICPECGLPRTSRAKSEATDPLYLMPKDVIVTFRNGAIAVMACLLGAAAGTMVMVLLGADRTVLALGMFGFALAWVICVWQITPAFEFRQAVRRGFSQTSNLRRSARWLQFAFPAAALCQVILVMFAGNPQLPTGLLQLMLLGFVLLGLTGLIVVSLLFEELADWSCDDVAEKFFRGAQWGMACGALILVLAMLSIAVMPNSNLTLFLYILAFPATFMLLVSIVAYLYALLSLSKSVTLSLFHANEYHERIRRRDERLREQDEREERLRQQATGAQPES